MPTLPRAIVSVAAMIAALLIVQPREAAACHGSDHISQSVTCFSGLNTAVAVSAFIVPDIYYAARKSWLPPRWAWAHVFVGGAVAASGIASIAMASRVTELEAVPGHSHGIAGKPAFLATMGGLILATGSWFVIHGAISLVRYRPPGATASMSASLPRSRSPFPSAWILPTSHGVSAGAAWWF